MPDETESRTEGITADPEPLSPNPGDGWRWSIHGGQAAVSESSQVQVLWRWIPPGTGRLGARGYEEDEEPVHDVVAKCGYWMLETPVTQAQWQAVMGGTNPSFHQDAVDWKDHPVERITWPMANQWCEALTQMVPLELGSRWRVRLPTEAMWEYACRAGTLSEYHSGDGEDALDHVGWYAANSGGRIHPVRGKQPNSWNLYDLHGNVWEWCADAWDSEAYLKRAEPWDVMAPGQSDKDRLRVGRGGSCVALSVQSRSACRGRSRPSEVNFNVGFRVCLRTGPV